MKKKLLILLVFSVQLSYGMLGSLMSSKLFKAVSALGAITCAIASTKNTAQNELGNEWVEDRQSIFDFFGSKKEMIVHTTTNEKSLNSILKNGLCSPRYLVESRLGPCADTDEKSSKSIIQCFDHMKEKFGLLEPEQIYFAPQESLIGKNGNVGILVNPHKTYVFNIGYKKGISPSNFDIEQYKKSKILLSSYLKQAKEAKKMQQERPGSKVCLDSQTAEPFYAHENQDYPFAYEAEIPFNKDCIPPTSLHLIQRNTFDRSSFEGYEKIDKWYAQPNYKAIGGTVLASAILYGAYKWYQGNQSFKDEKKNKADK